MNNAGVNIAWSYTSGTPSTIKVYGAASLAGPFLNVYSNPGSTLLWTGRTVGNYYYVQGWDANNNPSTEISNIVQAT